MAENKYLSFVKREGTKKHYEKRMKFVQGEYSSSDGGSFTGKEVLANVHGFCHGREKWENGKMIERKVAPIDQSFSADERGDRYYYMPVIDPETGITYIFGTRTIGGMEAVEELVYTFGEISETKPGCLPVICLSSESYLNKNGHENHKPVFKLSGWQAWAGAEDEPLGPGLSLAEFEKEAVAPAEVRAAWDAERANLEPAEY
jgi:hypothetical protein